MILVYKFDFVFIQNIKISLLIFHVKGITSLKGDTFCIQVCILRVGCWKPMCSASTHKLGQVTPHIKRG